MIRSIALAALALCSSTFAATSPHESAHRDPAFDNYRKALVAQLSKSSDARHLLAAGAYALIDFDQETAAKRARELFDRAAKAGANDAMVQWVAALRSCEGRRPCAAIERLGRDSDNAIVPIALFDSGPGATAPLTRAASSKGYDDYLWKLAQSFYEISADGPRAPYDEQGILDAKSAERANRIATSLGLAVSVALPPIDRLMHFCLTGAAPAAKDDCLKVARTITAGQASALSYQMGARLLATLSDDSAERDAWQARLDESTSLGERTGRAMSLLLQDAAGVEALTSAFTRSRDELAFQRAVIIAAAARGN